MGALAATFLLIGILAGIGIGIGYVALGTHYSIQDEDDKR